MAEVTPTARYVVTTTHYVYAESAEEALQQGMENCDRMNSLDDCHADVEKIGVKPFAGYYTEILDEDLQVLKSNYKQQADDNK